MAAHIIRAEVKAKLLELLAAEDALLGDEEAGIAPVQVSRGMPVELERESVWIGGVKGKISTPLMKSGRKARNDKFTITVIFMSAKPGDTETESESRIEGFFSALEDVVAEDSELHDIDGLEGAVLGEVEGPLTDPTTEGHASFLRADVECLARLT